MGRINVLGFDVANLIAAGEVVDRPSSVVKELIENAIDSGADKITVEIKNGGTSFIRITDNGCGMEHDELPVAILRHATSKIKDAKDLESIMTLGFRGEALAAISSVAKVRIMSKTKDSEMGSLLECHGGTVINHMKTGCQDGTTVIVEDIFYNVPARRKFLKKDVTEGLSVTSVVEKVALSRPDISFRYITDGNVKYATAGDGSLESAVYAILGRDVAKKTIKVSRQDNGISVSGFISTPELVRANRNFENFYINQRYVKSKTACAALEQAYISYIPSDKFPFCILNIEIDPTCVDVNVHPAKLEVKFSNEKIIFDAVYYAVRTALSNSISRPTLYTEDKKTEKSGKELLTTPFPVTDRSIEQKKPERIVFDSNASFGTVRKDKTIDYSGIKAYEPTPKEERKLKNELDRAEEAKKRAPVSANSSSYAKESAFSLKFPTPTLAPKNVEKPQIKVSEETVSEIPTKEETKVLTVPDYKIIGEAFNSYVIVELGDIMYMIDKHAAHERIIFEDLKKKLKCATPSSQMLMCPIELTLDSKELEAICQWDDEIRRTGFGFEISERKASIYEIPSEIEVSAAEDILLSLLAGLYERTVQAENARYDFFERALYQASCKAAIKAGRIYDSEHVKWICDRVLTFDNIKYCPHGRPVAFEITRRFLEKQFERI